MKPRKSHSVRLRRRAATVIGLSVVAAGIVAACESTPTAAPADVPEPQLNFTNGPASPSLYVMRDPDATFIDGALFHSNFAADGASLPSAGQERPLIALHYLDPLNHPVDGCGDDSSPDETVALQRVSTPSAAQRIVELYKDKESPVSVYEGLLAEYFADPCGFLATRLVAHGTANFTGHFQFKDGGPTRLRLSYNGTLEGVPSGRVRLNEWSQLLFTPDGLKWVTDGILLRTTGK